MGKNPRLRGLSLGVHERLVCNPSVLPIRVVWNETVVDAESE